MQRGWAVLLLSVDGTGGKIPPANCPECRWTSESYVKHSPADCGHLLCHGFYAATTDVDRFGKMLAALPGGQLAIRTGRASRLLVVDAEAHSKKPDEPSGLDVLEQWQQFTGEEWGLPVTLSSRSVSGGLHLYYRIPADVDISSGRILPNVDVKAEFGYVGAVSGQTNRVWIDPTVPVADAPPEFIDWLRAKKRMTTGAGGPGGPGGPGGGGGAIGTPDGYDYQKFVATSCPDGHRDYFFNDLCFRLRKQGLPRDQYEERIRKAWENCEQPKTNYMPWEHVQYKMDRVWATVAPIVDPNSSTIAWAHKLIAEASAAAAAADAAIDYTGVGGVAAGGGIKLPPVPPLAIGELDHEKWYKPKDDGSAERMRDVWGNWFRAIPRVKSPASVLIYDGVTWKEDTRNRLWQAMTYVTSLIPAEVEAWNGRALALEAEGVENWLTRRVGGNGQNADEFRAVLSLRKYASECEENARKERGIKAFCGLGAISISEEDLDSQTRYIGLPGRRVIDVEFVHEGRALDEWLIPARPDILITKKLGCEYVPPVTGVPETLYEFSDFKRYIEMVLPDPEVRDTLQEIAGYALLGRPTEKMILLLHGPPDSGKTVLLEVLEAMFGDYGNWADSGALIAGKAKSAHNEWLHKLKGLRLILTPETAKGAKIDAAWMKSYTGREPQSTRGAYGDRSVTWTPSGIIINASNHYIEYDAEDTAVAERTQVVEFKERFPRGDPRRDDGLSQRLKDNELHIVLNWALEGLRRHGARVGTQHAGIKIAPQIVAWSKKYRIAQDHVGQFIADALGEGKIKHVTCVDGMCDSDCTMRENAELPTHQYVLAKTVYSLYTLWCGMQNMKPLGRNTFNKHLRTVYHWCRVESHGIRWMGYTTEIGEKYDPKLYEW